MPCFNIIKKIRPDETFRVNNIINNFDLNVEETEERFEGCIDIENKDWNVGLIVGGSGTGKSTIAKQCFGEYYFEGFEYSQKSIIDDMPKNKNIKEIEKTFTSVGFASPPSWLKPYDVLSNGEKMRVELVRCLLENKDLIVFDEFTSVVDRTVAKTASMALSKAIKRENKKFVAVSCHKDIIEWLEPDWIFDTDEMNFFIVRERSTARNSNLKYIGLTSLLETKCGKNLGSIII